MWPSCGTALFWPVLAQWTRIPGILAEARLGEATGAHRRAPVVVRRTRARREVRDVRRPRAVVHRDVEGAGADARHEVAAVEPRRATDGDRAGRQRRRRRCAVGLGAVDRRPDGHVARGRGREDREPGDREGPIRRDLVRVLVGEQTATQRAAVAVHDRAVADLAGALAAAAEADEGPGHLAGRGDRRLQIAAVDARARVAAAGGVAPAVGVDADRVARVGVDDR